MLVQDHPKRDLLIAFVDGELDADQEREINRLIKLDPDAEKFVELLWRSALPYSEAFESLLSLPVPNKAKDAIEPDRESLKKTSNDRFSSASYNAAAGQSNSVQPSSSQPRFFPNDRFSLPLWLGVTAGFATGVFMTVLLSGWVFSSRPSTFVDSVSQYQSLYQRETVVNARVDVPALKEMMLQQLGRNITIPDFSDQGLEFKRGQLLQMSGKPLIQLVYLGSDGLPLALCITPSDTTGGETVSALSKRVPEFGERHGLNYGHWQKAGLDFVIVGDDSVSVSAATRQSISTMEI
ncbi:MAG: hypothetical protein GKR96_00280 [Gammaproteobacteria bacterium]|nr:hypothetical protein [Gammaproteobacteria bacterium]